MLFKHEKTLLFVCFILFLNSKILCASPMSLSFNCTHQYTSPGPGYPKDLELHDMDQDGLIDMVVLEDEKNSDRLVSKKLYLYKNLGNFQFDQITIHEFTMEIDIFDKAVLDADGDGLLDILVTTSNIWERTRELYIFYNNGVNFEPKVLTFADNNHYVCYNFPLMVLNKGEINEVLIFESMYQDSPQELVYTFSFNKRELIEKTSKMYSIPFYENNTTFEIVCFFISNPIHKISTDTKDILVSLDYINDRPGSVTFFESMKDSLVFSTIKTIELPDAANVEDLDIYPHENGYYIACSYLSPSSFSVLEVDHNLDIQGYHYYKNPQVLPKGVLQIKIKDFDLDNEPEVLCLSDSLSFFELDNGTITWEYKKFSSTEESLILYNMGVADIDNDSDLDVIICNRDNRTYEWFENQAIPATTGIALDESGKANIDFDFSNYPNPFNPVTYIKFDIPETGHVTIEIFDVLGRLVNTLADNQYEAGQHSVTWRGINTAGIQATSGMYFYRIRYQDQVQTKKMLLIR